MEMLPLTTGPDGKRAMSRNAEEALSVVDSQPGAEFARGTWWSAYNAFTFMVDHRIGANDDNRVSSALFGANRRKKIKAL